MSAPPIVQVCSPNPTLRREVLWSVAFLAIPLAAGLLSAPLTSVTRWIGLGFFLIIGWLAWEHVVRFHPYQRFGPANRVTLLRAAGASALVAFAVAGAALPEDWLWIAFTGVSILILLDGVDGWLARRSEMTSAFGARFDMEIDALTIMALAILCWEQGKAGVWVLLLGLMRYTFVLAIWVWPILGKPLPASFRRKATCVLQLTVLALCLAPPLHPPLTSGLAGLALTTLTWSFAVDLRWLTR